MLVATLFLWLLTALTSSSWLPIVNIKHYQVLATTQSGLRFEPETNSYSGLTFTFDPRLEKRVEWLHFEHWLSIMQHSSSLLYEALNGRAHLAEVRVLIPYKWRQFEWPVLHKPGVPIIMNRRLQFADSDVIVGFDDPIYKETPFALQHDECSKQGLNIHMPISFLEQNQQMDPKLKARLLVREFAAHRYGVFKESGFRGDPMYPPFSSLAGYSSSSSSSSKLTNKSGGQQLAQQQQQQQLMMMQQLLLDSSSMNQTMMQELLATSVKGFDEHWNECSFDTSPGSGLPLPQNLNCAPYLTTKNSNSNNQVASSPEPMSFNLMSADPFAYTSRAATTSTASQPLEWRQMSDSVKWHFCGENFSPITSSSSAGTGTPGTGTGTGVGAGAGAGAGGLSSGEQTPKSSTFSATSFVHNQLANNKQNIMCQEKSAMEVIRSNEDFRKVPFSPSTFNRLPATNFRFLQEMPPRLILCVEYSSHLYQSRRLEHGILEAAIGKFLAYDLIADTEMALVLFGQQHSHKNPFKRLDSSIDSRLTLYNPPLDPYDEQPKLYTEQELLQLDLQPQTASQAKLIRGTCSLAKALAEAGASLQQRSQYDDVGADLVMVTSGLFVEDEQKIEELLRNGGWIKNENLQLNLIIYPAAMLFDTRSRDSTVALDAIESEAIIRNRVNKLLLIQRLTGARLHLVREHLDSNGNVKMSTLLQFYQIFEHLSKGHSWDQTHSMALIGQQTVEARNQVNGTSKLSFQFQVDNSIQNELIVGFLDPKQHQLTRSGKRFALKNLQLRSPGGHLLLTDSHPSSWSNHHQHHHNSQDSSLISSDLHDGNPQNDEPTLTGTGSRAEAEVETEDLQRIGSANTAPSSTAESALFPYRTQLSLAGFHLKASHLAQLNQSSRLSGTWTLSATSDEPIQTDALAMARVNPSGDTLTARCWIQTYYSENHHHHHQQHHHQNHLDSLQEATTSGQRTLKAVKVFVQTRAGPKMGPVQELDARMEVQDELGNIVQNVNMLDDGLGAPDMTHGDGIHSQYVLRAHRPGFYRVNVELSGQNMKQQQHHHSQIFGQPTGSGSSVGSVGSGSGQGQDSPCCGSTISQPTNKQLVADTRYLSRQLYCGTFYAESGNRLAQQRPPRVNNLTVVNVDQENRRVTIRWQEPSVDISSNFAASNNKLVQQQDNELPVQELDSALNIQEPQALVSPTATRLERRGPSLNLNRRHLPVQQQLQRSSSVEELSLGEEDLANEQQAAELLNFDTASVANSKQNVARGLIVAGNHQQPAVASAGGGSRYEIKLFTDRDMLKRAFDAKQEVGFRFTEWNVEGSFPNASAYGGTKEVTLRVPYGREGVYYIAMKVYNNLGTGSHLSHIVQFWLRNNLTLEEAESIYNQAGNTIDAEGNVYDKNGELIQRSGAGSGAGGGQLGYLLPRGPGGNLDGIGILVLISVLAFVFSVVCISLVACLASSARRSLAKRRDPADDKKAVASGSSMGLGAGSGSSMVSGGSGCGSSQQSEVASSADSTTSGGGHDVEINKLSMVDELTAYTNLQQQHQHQQHQAQLIQNQLQLQQQQQQEVDYQSSIYQQHLSHTHQPAFVLNTGDDQVSSGKQKQQWLHHTMVNGYAYATVNPAMTNLAGHDGSLETGDLNQNGLGGNSDSMSPVQSWPADILLSHYDKVKQARERNEAPPVMRIETLENQGQFSDQGLPTTGVEVPNELSPDQSYLVRQQRNNQVMPNYFNLQLQQQLNSVLKNKHQRQIDHENSSPALEGVRGELPESGSSFQLQDQQQQMLAPPPPQYVYCGAGLTPDDCGSGLLGATGSQLSATDPSIYSQVTNLQQVSTSTSDQLVNNASTGSYYANQLWPPQQQQQLNHQSPLYSTSSSTSSSAHHPHHQHHLNHHQQQQQQQQTNEQFSAANIHQQTRIKLLNEDYSNNNNQTDKSNSAISEV